MDEEVLIPLTFFLVTGVTLFFWFYYRYRIRQDVQQTLRIALDKGNELSPEFLEQLEKPKPAKDRDLRRGLIWMGLALGTTIFGWGIPDEDAEVMGIMIGIAAFPFFIGLAYILMFFHGKKEESSV